MWHAESETHASLGQKFEKLTKGRSSVVQKINESNDIERGLDVQFWWHSTVKENIHIIGVAS